jgi:hypothetical protein
MWILCDSFVAASGGEGLFELLNVAICLYTCEFSCCWSVFEHDLCIATEFALKRALQYL